MIISARHGFVFIKGIKVGGTSIELFLSKVLGDDAVVAPANIADPAFRPRNYEAAQPVGNLTNHSTAVHARAFLGAESFSTMRRALVIRSPYEKIRSYVYFKLGQGVADIDVDRAIAGCSSEADRALDKDGHCLVTDFLLYERLNADLATFFAKVGVPFGGRLDVFEKAWQRQRYGHLPVTFSAAQQEAVRTKFAFEFAHYANAGRAALPEPDRVRTGGPGTEPHPPEPA